jgi:tetraacyldisaccharide 4'-kinase
MHWLETHWYRLSPLHLVLWPLSLVFGVLAALRRLLYGHGVLKSVKLAVPVIVVGNINVGGTGKTPCVIWLVSWLASRGLKPGIISRGYGGNTRRPQRVTGNTDPAHAGDEAVLLARRCACPVWTGSSRLAAARALLAAEPQCDVIVSDDGLQHYALKRDVELVVLDGERGCGNGMLLPAGPLRESLSRLECVDALIINGGVVFAPDMLPSGVPAFDMRLHGETFYALRPPHQEVGPEYFKDLTVCAMAGIGNPQKFFNRLHDLGISFTAHPFPDHHAFTTGDCAFGPGTAVIMTEKDAVKLERLAGESDGWWASRVYAQFDEALGELILKKIGK